MIISSRALSSNMQRPRARSPGWAAFDSKQREKVGSAAASEADPFPSISKMVPSGPTESLLTNNNTPVKSFASVVRPSPNFPLLAVDSKIVYAVENTGEGKQHNKLTKRTNLNPSVKWLKDVHCWVDDSLIEDVLVAVGSDVYQASSLLKAMVSSDLSKEEASPSAPCSSTADGSCDSKIQGLDQSISQDSQLSAGVHKFLASNLNKEEANPSAPCSSTANGSCDNKIQGLDQNISQESQLSAGVHKLLASKLLFPVPDEPEWEEDDMYLSHRKDALRMTRVASQHSRAASNAFMRGDHLSAHQLSLRAREEWLAAEKLNNKAAEKILQIRNNKNNIWKIDLHGLHASEAVNALKEHLDRIESQMIMSRSASSDALAQLGPGVLQSPLLESFSCLDIDSGITKKEQSQQRQSVLQVITGTGNHSRGQASLPTAVRSFLIENGYRFDDTRPGVLAVRPKFRHK